MSTKNVFSEKHLWISDYKMFLFAVFILWKVHLSLTCTCFSSSHPPTCLTCFLSIPPHSHVLALHVRTCTLNPLGALGPHPLSWFHMILSQRTNRNLIIHYRYLTRSSCQSFWWQVTFCSCMLVLLTENLIESCILTGKRMLIPYCFLFMHLKNSKL